MTYELAVELPGAADKFTVGDTIPISCEQTGWVEVDAVVIDIAGDRVTFLVDDTPEERGPVLN